jgi:phosphopantothenoylcysteine decarboxylase / phosphopantothenate---cysteine ligase
VRCITNRSSGKMGHALAKMARRRGARVILVTGQTYVKPPRIDIEVIPVTTALEMRNIVMDRYRECSVIIKAAAVADFRCKTENCQKMKKTMDATVMLELEKNPDIIAELGAVKEHRVLVGFAAETENVTKNAVEKLKRKQLDLVVANDVSKSNIGFGADDNEVTIVETTGHIKQVPFMSKDEVASIILDSVKKCLKKKKRKEEDWY